MKPKRYVGEFVSDVLMDKHPKVKDGSICHPDRMSIIAIKGYYERGKITATEAVRAICVADTNSCGEHWRYCNRGW